MAVIIKNCFFLKVKYSDTLILHLRIHSKRKKEKEQEEIWGDDGICLLPWLGDGFTHMCPNSPNCIH